MVIFFNISPTSNHLHPLSVQNCDSNSWLVVDEDDNVNSGLKGLIDNFKSRFAEYNLDSVALCEILYFGGQFLRIFLSR